MSRTQKQDWGKGQGQVLRLGCQPQLFSGREVSSSWRAGLEKEAFGFLVQEPRLSGDIWEVEGTQEEMVLGCGGLPWSGQRDEGHPGFLITPNPLGSR